MARNEKQWSAKERARLIELRNQKLEISVIAKMMGRTEGSVRTALHRYHRKGKETYCRNRYWTDNEVKSLAIYLITENATIPEIANYLNRSEGSVKAKILSTGFHKKRKVSRVGRPPDIMGRARLLDLLAEGLSPRQIAKVLGKAYNTIYKTLRRLAREDFVIIDYGRDKRGKYVITTKWAVYDDCK